MPLKEFAVVVVLNEQFFNEETAVITRYVKNKLNELAVVYSNKVFFVDSRKYVSLYKSMYIKCNQYEVTDAMLVVGEKVNVSNTLEQFGCFLSKSNKAFFMTLAGGGGDVYQDERRLGNVPAFNMEGEIDTCGAGDSATVGIVIGLCLGGSVLQAAQLGNAVAAVTIKKIGRTGEANKQEVFDVLRVTF